MPKRKPKLPRMPTVFQYANKDCGHAMVTSRYAGYPDPQRHWRGFTPFLIGS